MKYTYKINGIEINEAELLEQKLVRVEALKYIKKETLKLFRHNEWDETSYTVNWQLRNPDDTISENTLIVTLEK